MLARRGVEAPGESEEPEVGGGGVRGVGVEVWVGEGGGRGIVREREGVL